MELPKNGALRRGIALGVAIAWGAWVTWTVWSLTQPGNRTTVMAEETRTRFVELERRVSDLERTEQLRRLMRRQGDRGIEVADGDQ